MSQDPLFTVAMLKKLATPLSILALIGAATVSLAACGSSTPTGSGGAGGVGDTSTSTTTTGGGCSSPTECPGTDTDCSTRTCVAGVCGVTLAAAGTATTDQTPGDCLQSVCDGMGATTTQPDDADVLDDQNDCTKDVCAKGAPENQPTASGAACTSGGGKVCDGASKCVECVDAAACASGVCEKNKCVAASCTDKVKNHNETDVDCGGADCNKCATGKVCASGADCIDTICTAGMCAKATCGDAAKNGAETDVDCGGGTCGGCGPDLGCKLDADCVGGACSGTTCLPTCTDKVKNAGETDVDCGGPTCGVCADTKTCAVGADCKSKVCTGGVCVGASCFDMVQNGTESDKDCGGTCGPCSPLQMCVKGADCATGVCTGNVCQGAVCNDMIKNGSETDVDCGGMCATKCGTSKICLVAGDCASSVCTGGHCQAGICGDGVKSAVEGCDDGNPLSGDGCSSACAVESGFACSGAAPTVCTTICGDGVKVGAEQCDDGNATTGDGCSSACAIEIGFVCAGAPSACSTTCGDGLKAGAEACDDGNGIPNDGCTSCSVNAGFTCTGSAPSICKAICGDGVKAGAEQCDDGNLVNTDGCSSTCTVQAGYACTGATPSVCAAICGDNLIVGTESCDDGNIANGDCCSSACKIEAGCEIEQNGTIATANKYASIAVGSQVKGFISPVADKDVFEIIIPSGATGSITATTIDNFLGVLCSSTDIDTYLTIFNAAGTSLVTNDDVGYPNFCSTVTLTSLAAGSYYVEVKASSLAAITTFAYTAQINVVTQTCGNGITEGTEQCDGGATCAADCTLLPVCGNGVVTATETCDDGNTVSGDGCDATCHLEGATTEPEPNDTQAQADGNPVITGNALFLGAIGASGDKDIYKVTVATPSVVRFETFETGNLDCPTLGLTMKLFDSAFVQKKIDVQGAVNASGINNCAAIVLTLPAGSYYVQLEKTVAGVAPKYVFQVRFSTSVGAEIEPNGGSATATPLPGTEMNISGAHVSADLDWYAITIASSGLSVRAETIEEAVDVFNSSTDCEGLVPDTTLTLFNSAATSLVVDTDDGRGFCSAIDGTSPTPRDAGAHNLAAGTYYLQVSGASTYNYRLAVTVR